MIKIKLINGSSCVFSVDKRHICGDGFFFRILDKCFSIKVNYCDDEIELHVPHNPIMQKLNIMVNGNELVVNDNCEEVIIGYVSSGQQYIHVCPVRKRVMLSDLFDKSTIDHGIVNPRNKLGGYDENNNNNVKSMNVNENKRVKLVESLIGTRRNGLIKGEGKYLFITGSDLINQVIEIRDNKIPVINAEDSDESEEDIYYTCELNKDLRSQILHEVNGSLVAIHEMLNHAPAEVMSS